MITTVVKLSCMQISCSEVSDITSSLSDVDKSTRDLYLHPPSADKLIVFLTAPADGQSFADKTLIR